MSADKKINFLLEIVKSFGVKNGQKMERTRKVSDPHTKISPKKF